MKDHALIGKFLGLWPSERDLARWIKTWWNPKGEYDFSTHDHFLQSENKDRVFQNGPYFFNSAWLYLWFWTDRFSPKKKDFSFAPV
jgi:hypothetical protein